MGDSRLTNTVNKRVLFLSTGEINRNYPYISLRISPGVPVVELLLYYLKS